MSFWESELGEVLGTPDVAFAKEFSHIPNNTMALAKITSFHNSDQGYKHLEIEWTLTDGAFKGQKVFHKIKAIDAAPMDKDPAKTRHRALNMLKLIYQLFNVKPKHTNIPTDQDLAVFEGKIAGIKIRETEPNAEGKQYNWVAEVHNSQGFQCETGTPLVPNVVVTRQNKTDHLDSAFSRNQSVQELEIDVPF